MGVAGARERIHLVIEASISTVHMTNWYLVWVEGLRGPEPQKWSDDALWGQRGRTDVIVRFALSEREAGMSLDQLAKLHPIPPG